eukprot:GGOE01061913.1.p1 GENE.GGOE01061913.1~~GGOE01061913.1.p1  ORF type:complete len:445 (-),score=78.21 GGOE01061913.1:254-1588(-)
MCWPPPTLLAIMLGLMLNLSCRNVGCQPMRLSGPAGDSAGGPWTSPPPLSLLCSASPSLMHNDTSSATASQHSHRLQQTIAEYQHPPDCQTARLLLFPPAFGIMGMAATLLHLREAMLLAHATGRSFIVPADWLAEYVNPTLCPAKSLACYLLPFAKCTVEDAGPRASWGTALCDPQRAVEASPTLASEEALNITFPSFSGGSRYWLLKEYAQYLLRPAAALQALVQQYASGMSLAPGQYLSAYLRSSKYRADFPAECAPTKDQSAARILQFLQSQGLGRVFLAADSVELRRHITKFLSARGMAVMSIPDAHFPTLALCRGLENHHIQVGLNCYQDRANETQHDEGLELLAMFLLLSRSGPFIATECTTIRVLVNELRWASTEPIPHHSLQPSGTEGGRHVRASTRRLCQKCLRFYDHLSPLRRVKAWDVLRYQRVAPPHRASP